VRRREEVPAELLEQHTRQAGVRVVALEARVPAVGWTAQHW
jgi:hypothetical protein